MPLPHEIVAQAAVIARKFANEAARHGESDNAAYSDQVAIKARDRALRLAEIEAIYPDLCSSP
jgi:hypothetical protein